MPVSPSARRPCRCSRRAIDIGRAIPQLYARECADVAIVSQSGDHEGPASTHGNRWNPQGRRADTLLRRWAIPHRPMTFLGKPVSPFGTLDMLVNGAGVGAGGISVADLDGALLEKGRRTHSPGSSCCDRALVRLRRKACSCGRMVTISSVAQHLPTPESAFCGMAKAGLGPRTRSLSRSGVAARADSRVTTVRCARRQEADGRTPSGTSSAHPREAI